MRYEDARRLRGVESVWFRLKLWLHSMRRQGKTTFGNLDQLSDHDRRDIGLPEPVQYVDWHALQENGWR